MNQIKNHFRKLLTLSLMTILASAVALSAAESSESNKQFLTSYTQVHKALVEDDLAAAKTAAGALGQAGAPLAKSSSLKEARVAFEKLTVEAKTRSAGQSDYHVFHCPMLKKDWVQTSTTTANPYGGKEMVTCGEIQK